MKPMKAYEWILFDIDETLFHFDSFSGLKLALTRLGFELSQHDFDAYETINKSLWIDYQNCKITSQQLQHTRFKSWAAKLQIPADHLIEAFQSAMAEITKPLDGAIPLLDALRGKKKMGIITNGFTHMQHARLERTGLKDHFEVVVISEQVGIPKPQPGIFEHALEKMGKPERDKVLMVGDNPECDIVGAINAGIDACWLNANNRPLAKEINPHYQVSSLVELKNLLFQPERHANILAAI